MKYCGIVIDDWCWHNEDLMYLLSMVLIFDLIAIIIEKDISGEEFTVFLDIIRKHMAQLGKVTFQGHIVEI